MFIRLANIFKVGERTLILLNGEYDLKNNSFSGKWEQLSVPTVTLSNVSMIFSQVDIYTPTLPQISVITMTGLVEDLLITAPPNYQVSTDNSTWNTYLTIVPSIGGTGSSTATLYVRLNSTSKNNVGKVKLSSPGLIRLYINVNGTVLSFFTKWINSRGNRIISGKAKQIIFN